MRVLKLTILAVVLLALIMSITLMWLVRSEQGSHWLLVQGLDTAPVDIEVSGISGTLHEGLGVDNLTIKLPLANIHASEVSVSWNPVRLFAGIIDINSINISALDIDLIADTDTTDADDKTPNNNAISGNDLIDDELFWLQLPVKINIQSGKLDKLSIDAVEFNNIHLVGAIGHGHLQLESLQAQSYGVNFRVNGKLTGPGPGRIVAAASWDLPSSKLSGNGNFKGNTQNLAFTHVINVPETVNFNGTIHDLFADPRLEGIAEWASVRLPGEKPLYSKSGNLSIHSDFITASLKGSNNILLEGWPEAPMQLDAEADYEGITINSYSIKALDGDITGKGDFNYAETIQGQLTIKGSKLNTERLQSDIAGTLDIDAMLLIKQTNVAVIDISRAKAKIADRDISGQGSAKWHQGELTSLKANVSAGTNELKANILLGDKLSGDLKAVAPDLSQLWPGLEGTLNASILLGGKLAQPDISVSADAANLSFDTHSLDTLKLSGALKENGHLTGLLTTTDMTSRGHDLGNLEFSLAGELADHESIVNLSGGVINVTLNSRGNWDGKQLIHVFDYGKFQPDDLDSWQLTQNPELRLSSDSGQISAHCWNQTASSICLDDTTWDANNMQGAINISRLSLRTLQPLLADGYSIDGTADATMKVVRDTRGLQGELHWQQSQTKLGYTDEISTFTTVLEKVTVDILSNDTQTDLNAHILGEQELSMAATAKVSGALSPESALQASAKGRLPSIGLLRPLIQRVVHPGELQGELTVNIEAGGTLENPILTGDASLVDGTLGLVEAGITLTNINITALSDGSGKLLLTGSLKSGDGSANISGEIRDTENAGLIADIRVKGENLASVRTPNLIVDTSPDIAIHIGENLFDISGTLTVPKATATISELPRGAIRRSPDTVIHTTKRPEQAQQETIVTGNVAVILGDDVQFSGFGLNSSLDGGLRLTQLRGGNLRSNGTVRVRDGFLTGYGKELRVDHGELTFIGALDDPLINIQVSRETIYENRQYTIGLRLTGSASNVKTEPFSRPAMSERDVLSFLLLDRPAGSDADVSSAALALGLQQLVPGDSGTFGLDEISFETNDANQATMVAGKRINDRLYVRYVFGILGEPGSFRVRYRLGRGFSLEGSTGARQSLDLIYLLER